MPSSEILPGRTDRPMKVSVGEEPGQVVDGELPGRAHAELRGSGLLLARRQARTAVTALLLLGVAEAFGALVQQALELPGGLDGDTLVEADAVTLEGVVTLGGALVQRGGVHHVCRCCGGRNFRGRRRGGGRSSGGRSSGGRRGGGRSSGGRVGGGHVGRFLGYGKLSGWLFGGDGFRSWSHFSFAREHLLADALLVELSEHQPGGAGLHGEHVVLAVPLALVVPVAVKRVAAVHSVGVALQGEGWWRRGSRGGDRGRRHSGGGNSGRATARLRVDSSSWNEWLLSSGYRFTSSDSWFFGIGDSSGPCDTLLRAFRGRCGGWHQAARHHVGALRSLIDGPTDVVACV